MESILPKYIILLMIVARKWNLVEL